MWAEAFRDGNMRSPVVQAPRVEPVQCLRIRLEDKWGFWIHGNLTRETGRVRDALKRFRTKGPCCSSPSQPRGGSRRESRSATASAGASGYGAL